MKFFGLSYDQVVFQGVSLGVNRSSLVKIESTFHNSAVIIAGDFNRPDLKSTAKTFQLKSVISFPTRGVNTALDQIFTNLSGFYFRPISAPPFGLSDNYYEHRCPKEATQIADGYRQSEGQTTQ